MTGFFQRLFGAKPSPSSQEEPLTTNDVQAKALLGFLIPQLQLLGLELEKVPVAGEYISKRSRGYIYGMAAAVLEVTSKDINSDIIDDIMQAAFTLVWGRENARRVFDVTLAECAARDGETLAGSYRAEADVGEVYAGKAHATVMGFWLLNNGLNDPEKIMPSIESPRPLPPISPDPASIPNNVPYPGVEENKIKLLCECFGQIVMPQLEKIGINPGNIEHNSLAGSSQACGYIHGICSEIVNLSKYQPNDEYGVVLSVWAFDEMYGKIGQALQRKTMEAIVEQDMSTIHGVLLARKDIAAFEERRSDYAACGFWQIASGTLFKE